MRTRLKDDIHKGLLEKQESLSHWHKISSLAEQEIALGPQGETQLQAHMHVIDSSLEKLNQDTLGVCVVCHEPVDTRLLQMDYTACVCLDHYSTQERRELEDDLELSQVVQRGLLPQDTPSIAGMEIAAFSRPAQIIGGDYFDFLRFSDGSHGVVIGDVSGKGMAAGMLISSLQTAFHTLVPESDSPIKVLERINRLYIHNINFTTFVTIFFGQIDPQTHTLTYANAGHNPAYLYHPNRKTGEWLLPSGAAIGLTEAFSIQTHSLQLEPGDLLLLYTDGLTEAVNSQMQEFGQARLAGLIEQNQDLPTDLIMQKLLEALNDHLAGHALLDDTTLILCRRM